MVSIRLVSLFTVLHAYLFRCVWAVTAAICCLVLLSFSCLVVTHHRQLMVVVVLVIIARIKCDIFS